MTRVNSEKRSGADGCAYGAGPEYWSTLDRGANDVGIGACRDCRGGIDIGMLGRLRPGLVSRPEMHRELSDFLHHKYCGCGGIKVDRI